MFQVLPCEPVISHCQMCMAQEVFLPTIECPQQSLKRHDLLGCVDLLPDCSVCGFRDVPLWC